LPAEITARANLVGREPGVSATFDVTLTTPDGAPVATITGLVMRALDTHRLADTAASVTGDPLDQLLASGIRRADADHLFARAFASPERRIIISSIPLAAIRALYVARNTPAATARPASANAPAAFANAIEARLATMFGELLGVEQVGPDDEFLALGGHSLAAVRLFARMRKEWNVDLPLAILFEAPSVRALAAEIVAVAGLTPEPIAAPAAETSIKPATATAETTAALATAAPARPRGKPWSPLVRLAPGIAGARPVFCVHGAGGNVFSGKPLADIIGRTHPFYGLQAQGVDGTLPFHETIEEMAECYLAAIETIDDTGPYAFIGYSGGGVIIYEMAHRLRAKGRDVSVLAAIDTLAPSAAQARSRLSDWIAYAREIGVLQAADEIAMTILGKSRSFVEARLPVRFQTKLKIDPLQERANRLFATFLEAQRRYQMRPLDADLILFRAARPSVHFHRAGPMLGWERHVTGRIHVQAIDADHDTIVASANAGLVADAIMAAIGGDQRQPKSIGSQGRR
jgi:thioesterase domain-containing protein/acyl carrier protein